MGRQPRKRGGVIEKLSQPRGTQQLRRVGSTHWLQATRRYSCGGHCGSRIFVLAHTVGPNTLADLKKYTHRWA